MLCRSSAPGSVGFNSCGAKDSHVGQVSFTNTHHKLVDCKSHHKLVAVHQSIRQTFAPPVSSDLIQHDNHAWVSKQIHLGFQPGSSGTTVAAISAPPWKCCVATVFVALATGSSPYHSTFPKKEWKRSMWSRLFEKTKHEVRWSTNRCRPTFWLGLGTFIRKASVTLSKERCNKYI